MELTKSNEQEKVRRFEFARNSFSNCNNTKLSANSETLQTLAEVLIAIKNASA